jgi:hypothetical protein
VGGLLGRIAMRISGFARDRAWSASAPRTALHRVAVVGLQHNPIIPAHYARKRAQGTAKMNARGD